MVSTRRRTACHISNVHECHLPFNPRTKNIPRTDWGVIKCAPRAKRTAKAALVHLQNPPHIKSDWINYYSTVIVCTVNVLTSACSSSEALNPCSGQSHGQHAFGEDFHLRVSFALPGRLCEAYSFRHPSSLSAARTKGRTARRRVLDRRDEIFSSGSACGVRKGGFSTQIPLSLIGKKRLRIYG